MADDRSIEELQSELKSKQEERDNLRAQRQAAQDEQRDEIVKAQLRAEIDKVDRDIQAEQDQLNAQLSVDVVEVGTGQVAEPAPEPPPVPDAPDGESGDKPADGDAQEGSN